MPTPDDPVRPPDATPRDVPARWRVPTRLIMAKAVGALLLAVVAAYSALVGGDRLQVLVAGAAAVGVGVFALRDALAPVRLEADADGVTVVTGFARRVRLPWSRVEAVRVDVRSRYGLRSEHLEIDVGETLYVFSAYDLGAPPTDVARALTALRTG